MNGQLCDWLDEELEMKALASELRDVLRLHGSVKSLFNYFEIVSFVS